jgi:cyclohexanone monooxygenase
MARPVRGPSEQAPIDQYDAVIVGAGFAGIYMLQRLRERGFVVRVLEAAAGVGGVWYWNRYPGARCDVESLEYQLNISEEIQREWNWSERYAAQAEIMRYMNFVADRLGLRKDIQLETRVTAMTYDQQEASWIVETDRNDRFRARHCIMATGCLSAAQTPAIPGLEGFQGDWYHTGEWPHGGVRFDGKRVGVVGTGSSGIQSIPVIAAEADKLYVFQRAPNFVLPANNRALRTDESRKSKDKFAEDRRRAHQSFGGTLGIFNEKPARDLTPEQRALELEARYRQGGFSYLMSFADLLTNDEANEYAARFIREKIAQIVRDPEVAKALTPIDHPIGTKRLCLDTNYLEAFNAPNVKLIDLRKDPIDRISAKGLVCAGREFELDVIVFATGFDAMTGALLDIDIRGRGGVSLRERWAAGPRTYLGTGVAGFPNLFLIAGPGTPAVLTNTVVAIEQHADFVADCIVYLRDRDIPTIEALPDAESNWVDHVNAVAHLTLYPRANSWYMGANIPGKPRIFMPYVGGLSAFRQKCEAAAAAGYEGFLLGRRGG